MKKYVLGKNVQRFYFRSCFVYHMANNIYATDTTNQAILIPIKLNTNMHTARGAHMAMTAKLIVSRILPSGAFFFICLAARKSCAAINIAIKTQTMISILFFPFFIDDYTLIGYIFQIV